MLLPLLLRAQQTEYLSLQEALDQSSEQNAVIATALLEARAAKADRHQTDAVFLPQVSVGYNAMVTNNPLNAFGFLLQQSRVTAADFDPARLNHPKATQNYGASLDVQMPLLNVDLFYQRKGARRQEEAFEHKAQYTRNYVRFEVEKAYTQLQFAYRAKEILELTLQDVEQIHRSVEHFYEQGLLQKSDVLLSEVEVNTIQTALANAQSNISNASEGLHLLMGLEVTEKKGDYLTDPLQEAIAEGLRADFSTQRADLMAMQKGVEASGMMAKSAAMAYLPSINAFGSYQFNDNRAFGFKEDSYLVGINLTWKLFSGNRNRSKHRSMLLQHAKMQRELDLKIDQSRIELNRITRSLADLRYEIRQQQTSVEQAQEAVRILSDRHHEGLVSTTDLLMAQARLSQHRLQLAQTIMNYNITHYYRNLLTTVN